MKKQAKTILILCLAMGGLFGLLFWDDWKTKKEETEKQETGFLQKFDGSKVKEIVYYSNPQMNQETGSKTEITLKKEGNAWLLDKPVQSSADASQVDNFLKSLNEFKSERIVSEDQEKWKEYGLTEPSRKITLNFEDGKSITYIIGSKSPVGYQLFVALDSSSKVHVGSQYLLTSTLKTVFDFREKSIFKINENEISSIAFNGKKNFITFSILKNESTPYVIQLLDGSKIAADSNEVSEFIKDLNELKASEFKDSPVKEEQKKFLAGEEVYTVEIKNKDQSKSSFTVGLFEKKPWVSFDLAKLIIIFPEESKAKLTKSLKDFRDRKLVSWKAATISKVEIDTQKYAKLDDKWQVEGDESKTEKPFIRAFLTDLEFTKAEDILDGKNFPKKELSEVALHKVKIFWTEDGKENQQSIEIFASKGTKGSYLAKISDRPSQAFAVSKNIIANITEPSLKTNALNKDMNPLEGISK